MKFKPVSVFFKLRSTLKQELMMGATFTIAPFQGATFCIDALRGRSGFVLRTTP